MKENGNALFLILIAVALFAALSYAVTNSGRGGGGIDREQNEIEAGVLMQQAQNVETAVTRMRITGGVAPKFLDFSGDISQTAANTNCTTDNCRVFLRDGGGAEEPAVSAKAIGPGVTANLTAGGQGEFSVHLVSVMGVGTTAGDIVLAMKGLSKEICDIINIELGIYERGDAELADTLGAASTDWRNFANDMDPIPSVTADSLGDDDNRIDGQRTFCTFRTATSGYYLYHVLYAR